jgi:hypothetical protein
MPAPPKGEHAWDGSLAADAALVRIVTPFALPSLTAHLGSGGANGISPAAQAMPAASRPSSTTTTTTDILRTAMDVPRATAPIMFGAMNGQRFRNLPGAAQMLQAMAVGLPVNWITASKFLQDAQFVELHEILDYVQLLKLLSLEFAQRLPAIPGFDGRNVFSIGLRRICTLMDTK